MRQRDFADYAGDIMDSNITCNQFLCLLHKYEYIKEYTLDEIKTYGRHRGWLEEQEILFGDSKIERRHAARILHEFIRIELHEKEEEDWHCAMKLRDLFDCRSCVNHVAQVYVKGIMTAYKGEQSDTILCFGMRNFIQLEEAVEMLERVFHPEKRNRINTSVRERQDGRLIYEEACTMIVNNAECVLVDVRLESDYIKSHMEHAINIPLGNILSDSIELEVKKDKSILLYCDKGYQSEAARVYLQEQGFEKVFSFGLQ